MAAPALAQYQPYPQQQYPQYQYPQQQYPQYQYPQQQYPQYQQQYPQYPQYQQQYQQQYPQQGGIAGIINQLLGNRYATNDRTAIAQCAAAAQQQAAVQMRPQGYGAYNQGYGQAYVQSTARVTGITNVERRQNGLRVSGVMSSGRNYGAYNQGYNQGYNRAYAGAVNDLTFRCNVDYRGAVTNVRVRPAGYRG
jgi:hypothetical protein